MRTNQLLRRVLQILLRLLYPTDIICIKQFAEIVINRLEYIQTIPGTLRVAAREFSNEIKGVIVSTRPSSLQQTPAGEQIQERGIRRAAEEEHPESPSERAASRRGRRRDVAFAHFKVKASAREFMIIKNHIIDYPQFFGKYFRIKQGKIQD